MTQGPSSNSDMPVFPGFDGNIKKFIDRQFKKYIIALFSFSLLDAVCKVSKALKHSHNNVICITTI